jgi:predicted DNA-binding protein
VRIEIPSSLVAFDDALAPSSETHDQGVARSAQWRRADTTMKAPSLPGAFAAARGSAATQRPTLHVAPRCITLHRKESAMRDQLTVRLPEDLSQALELASQRLQRKSSEIVRLALRAYLAAPDQEHVRRAERVRHLFGSLETGVPDLAQRHREYVLESLRNGR